MLFLERRFFRVTKRVYKYIIVPLAVCELLYTIRMYLYIVDDINDGIGAVFLGIYFLYMCLPLTIVAFSFSFISITMKRSYYSLIALSDYYVWMLYIDRIFIKLLDFWGGEVAGTVLLIILLAFSLSFVEENNSNPPNLNNQNGIYFYPKI